MDVAQVKLEAAARGSMEYKIIRRSYVECNYLDHLRLGRENDLSSLSPVAASPPITPRVVLQALFGSEGRSDATPTCTRMVLALTTKGASASRSSLLATSAKETAFNWNLKVSDGIS